LFFCWSHLSSGELRHLFSSFGKVCKDDWHLTLLFFILLFGVLAYVGYGQKISLVKREALYRAIAARWDSCALSKVPGVSKKNSAIAAVLLVVTACAGGTASFQRWRIDYVGRGVFFTVEPLVEITDSPFFKHLKAAQNVYDLMHDVEEILRERFSSRDKVRVFFGPRIEFSYAATGIVPAVRLPIWWHPGNSYPASETDKIVEEFKKNRFQTCIFLKGDVGYFPSALRNFLDTNYKKTSTASVNVYDLLSDAP
jgi:hypothetical protein